MAEQGLQYNEEALMAVTKVVTKQTLNPLSVLNFNSLILFYLEDTFMAEQQVGRLEISVYDPVVVEMVYAA